MLMAVTTVQSLQFASVAGQAPWRRQRMVHGLHLEIDGRGWEESAEWGPGATRHFRVETISVPLTGRREGPLLATAHHGRGERLQAGALGVEAAAYTFWSLLFCG